MTLPSGRLAFFSRPLAILAALSVFGTTMAVDPRPAVAEDRCPLVDSAAAARSLGVPVASVVVTARGLAQTCILSAAQPGTRAVVTAVTYASVGEAVSRFQFTLQRGGRTGAAVPINGLGDEAARIDLLTYVRVKQTVYSINVLNGSSGDDLAGREAGLAQAIAGGTTAPAAGAHPVAALGSPRAIQGQMQAPVSQTPARAPAASAPVVLTATHRLFSPVVASAFSAAGIAKTTQRANFAPPPGFDRFSAVALVDGVYTSGAIECTAMKSPADRLVLEETPNYLIATMRCGRALYRPIGTHVTEMRPHELTIAYRKAAIARVFEASTGLRIRAERFVPNRKLVKVASMRDAPVRMANTRDERELAACIAGFDRFRNDRQTSFFRAVFYARIYHCESDVSLGHALAVRSLATFANRAPRIRSHGVSPAIVPHLFTRENFSAPDLVQAAAPIYHDSGLVGVQTGFVPKGALIFKVGLGVVYPTRSKDAQSVLFQLSVDPYSKSSAKVAPQPSLAALQHGLSSGAHWPGAVAANAAFHNLAEAPSLTEAPALPDPCAGFTNPPGLVIQRKVTPNYTPTVKGQIGTEIDAAPYTAAFSIDWDDFNTIFKGFRDSPKQTDMLIYARATPVSAAGTCLAMPSAWMPVAVHDVYPQELAEYTQHKKDEELRNSVAGNDGKKGSPMTVSFVSYTPPIVPDYEQAVYLVANRQIEDGTLQKFGIDSGKHAVTQGCSFRPERIIAWSHEDHSDDESKLERAWDAIIWVFATYTGLIDIMESAVVDAATYALSGASCPFGDPTAQGDNAPGEKSACSTLRSGCRVALDVALVAAGMPASGGTAATVLNEGASWASDALATQVAAAGPMIGAAGSFAIDKLKDALVGDISKRLYQQSLMAVHCTDPIAAQVLAPYANFELSPKQNKDERQKEVDHIKQSTPGNTLLAQELDSIAADGFVLDPAGCASAPSNPFTWGAWDPARNPRSAIAWMRVRKNAPAGVGAQDQYIAVHDDGGMFDDRVIAVPLGRMMVGESIDIPVVLEPNYDKYRSNPQVASYATSEIDPIGIKQELWNIDYVNGAGVDLFVSSSYQWTTQPVSVSNSITVLWGDRQTPIRTAFGGDDQPPVAPDCDPQL